MLLVILICEPFFKTYDTIPCSISSDQHLKEIRSLLKSRSWRLIMPFFKKLWETKKGSSSLLRTIPSNGKILSGGQLSAKQVLESDVKLEWENFFPLTQTPIEVPVRNWEEELQAAVDKFLEKGTVKQVPSVPFPRIYRNLFLHPQKMGDLCLMIDLSTLNNHMVVLHLELETAQSVRSSIRSKEWAVSIDIRGAYLHVPMNRAVRKYLRFMVNRLQSVKNICTWCT